jgi:hypothetical protein
VFEDLLVWKYLFENFDGHSYFMDEVWISNDEFELFTDSAGGKSKGCGIYFNNRIASLQHL